MGWFSLAGFGEEYRTRPGWINVMVIFVMSGTTLAVSYDVWQTFNDLENQNDASGDQR